MTGLETLLEEAAQYPAEVDVTGDLRRGHRALRRRRTRIAAGLTGGLIALGAVGVSVLPLSTARDHVVQPTVDPGAPLVHTPYYEVPQPPSGWHVEGSRPDFVTLSRDGGANDSNIENFDGKILIQLHAFGPGQWFGFGTTTQYDGRTFYDDQADPDKAILAVRVAGRGWLRLEYPRSTGFDTQPMIEYLDAVVVLPAAQGTED